MDPNNVRYISSVVKKLLLNNETDSKHVKGPRVLCRLLLQKGFRDMYERTVNKIKHNTVLDFIYPECTY